MMCAHHFNCVSATHKYALCTIKWVVGVGGAFYFWSQTIRLLHTSVGTTGLSMLLRLMLAMGVFDAHPEQLLRTPTPTYLQGEKEGLKRRNRKVKRTMITHRGVIDGSGQEVTEEV